MMKTIAMIFLWNVISKNCNGAYSQLQCYFCNSSCSRPGADDIKACSDSSAELSGKIFVAGALNSGSEPYNELNNQLHTYGVNTLEVNATIMPNFGNLTRWACYVTKDNRRGCLLMGSGICKADKSWLGTITSIGDKISKIMAQAKQAVSSMFKNPIISKEITDTQKTGIANWFGQDYMGKLINNTNADEFKLESCCEGNKCNSASMIQKSIAVVVLSISILV